MLLNKFNILAVKMGGVKLRELSLEGTQRCNIACEHCYKGTAQEVDLDPKVLTAAFEYFKDIEKIYLKGGESTMVAEPLRQINKALGEHKTKLYTFGFVTNLTFLNEEFFDILEDINAKCNPKGWSLERGVRIDISHDAWHAEAMQKIGKTYKDVENNYKTLRARHPRLQINYRDWDEKIPAEIEPIGRGLNVSPLARKGSLKKLNTYFIKKAKELNSLYINAKGDIINDFMSNAEGNQSEFGSVLQTPITELLIKNAYDTRWDYKEAVITSL